MKVRHAFKDATVLYSLCEYKHIKRIDLQSEMINKGFRSTPKTEHVFLINDKNCIAF